MIELTCGGCERSLGILLYLMAGCLSSLWCQVTLLSITSPHLKCMHAHTHTHMQTFLTLTATSFLQILAEALTAKTKPWSVKLKKDGCVHFLILHFDKGRKIQHPLSESKEWNFNIASINRGHESSPRWPHRKVIFFVHKASKACKC